MRTITPATIATGLTAATGSGWTGTAVGVADADGPALDPADATAMDADGVLDAIGLAEGEAVAVVVGAAVALAVGFALGRAVGLAVGRAVGLAVGRAVGLTVGRAVGVAAGPELTTIVPVICSGWIWQK